MSLYQKFDKYGRYIIYILLSLSIAIPLMSPIGLPILIGEETRVWYERVEQLSPGSIVHFGTDMSIGGYGSLRARMVASIRHLLEKDCKIVFIGFFPDAPQIYELLMQDASPIPEGKEYGVDWVCLGYIPGKEVGISAYAIDIRNLISVDYRGTPLDEIPLMNEVNSIEDFALVQCHSTGGMPMWYVDQMFVPYGTEIQANVLGVLAPEMRPFYPDQISGFLSTPRQGAEYELLINKPGVGIGDFDAQTIAHVVLLCFIVIGNVIEVTQSKKVTGRLV